MSIWETNKLTIFFFFKISLHEQSDFQIYVVLTECRVFAFSKSKLYQNKTSKFSVYVYETPTGEYVLDWHWDEKKNDQPT